MMVHFDCLLDWIERHLGVVKHRCLTHFHRGSCRLRLRRNKRGEKRKPASIAFLLCFLHCMPIASFSPGTKSLRTWAKIAPPLSVLWFSIDAADVTVQIMLYLEIWPLSVFLVLHVSSHIETHLDIWIWYSISLANGLSPWIWAWFTWVLSSYPHVLPFTLPVEHPWLWRQDHLTKYLLPHVLHWKWCRPARKDSTCVTHNLASKHLVSKNTEGTMSHSIQTSHTTTWERAVQDGEEKVHVRKWFRQ